MRRRVALHSLAFALAALGALGACASVRYNADVSKSGEVNLESGDDSS